MKSGILTLTSLDFIKGLIIAVIGALVGLIYPILLSQSWIFDFTAIWHTAVLAAVTYLLKQLGTTNDERFLGIGKPM